MFFYIHPYHPYTYVWACIFLALLEIWVSCYFIVSQFKGKLGAAPSLLLKDTCPACIVDFHELCALCDFMTGHASLDKIYEPCVKIRERLLRLHALTPFFFPFLPVHESSIDFSHRSMATRTYSCQISHLAQASSASRSVVHFPSRSLIRRRRVLPDKVSGMGQTNWAVATFSSRRGDRFVRTTKKTH